MEREPHRVEERRREPLRPRPFGRRAGDQVELTDRQREVLRLVADGLENKEIAGLLGISEQGVKQQVSVLLRKFDAPSRAVLARTALTMKLLGSTSGQGIPFEYLFDRAPVLIAMSKGPRHEFTLVNRAFVAMFGDRGYVGKSLAECFPEMRSELAAQIDDIFARGRPWTRHEERLRFELPDGAPREVFLSLVGEPTRGADGAVEGIVFYAWDVSEQIALRHRLQRLTAEQKVLLEQLPVGVVYTDEDARPVLVNPTARRILGKDFDPARPLYETLVGWNARYTSTGAAVGPSDGPSARAIAGWPFDDEVLVSTGEGTKRIHVSARPLHDESGGVTGAALVLAERTLGVIPDERAVDTVPSAPAQLDST